LATITNQTKSDIKVPLFGSLSVGFSEVQTKTPRCVGYGTAKYDTYSIQRI